MPKKIEVGEEDRKPRLTSRPDFDSVNWPEIKVGAWGKWVNLFLRFLTRAGCKVDPASYDYTAADHAEFLALCAREGVPAERRKATADVQKLVFEKAYPDLPETPREVVEVKGLRG